MDFLKSLQTLFEPEQPAPALKTVTTAVDPIHPFYPKEIQILNFVANDLSLLQLLSSFAAGCAVILSLTWLLASTFGPRLKTVDKFIALWFCLCREKSRTCERTNTDALQAVSSTYSSRAILHIIILEWAECSTCLVNCGRNTRYPTRDI
jgi:hypothetical protein